MASIAESDLTTVFQAYFPVDSEIVVNEMENPNFVSKTNGQIITIWVNADAEQRIGVSGLQVPNLELLNHLTPHLLVVPDSDGGILS